MDDNRLMSTDETRPRAKRKDAARNNERLIQAAREVFARQGLSATLEDIAQHAGVGVGTVYRNFASKQEIVESLYDAVLDSAVADVQSAMRIDDPWLAIVTFFETTAGNQATDRGLSETVIGRHGVRPSEQSVRKLIAALSPLFDRAIAAGVLRDGVTVTDIYPIFAMLDGVYRIHPDRPDLWRRYLTLLLDGIRATDRPTLTVPPLDATSFTAAMVSGGSAS
jgi:AcrR family transcriptional regulator